MKFMLIIHMNPVVWDALPQERQNAIGGGHVGFQKDIRASNEMIATYALAAPPQSAVVQARNGEPVVTDGPFIESKEFLAGFYLVECDNRERALEIAAAMPEMQADGIAVEVREIIHAAGATE